MATFRGLHAVYSSATPKYRSVLYESFFNHILIIQNFHHNLFDTSVCIAFNLKVRSQLLILFNATAYITFYECYIIGLKMAILGRNM